MGAIAFSLLKFFSPLSLILSLFYFQTFTYRFFFCSFRTYVYIFCASSAAVLVFCSYNHNPWERVLGDPFSVTDPRKQLRNVPTKSSKSQHTCLSHCSCTRFSWRKK